MKNSHWPFGDGLKGGGGGGVGAGESGGRYVGCRLKFSICVGCR